PGQFVNVLPKIGFSDPMLRRPFSIYNAIGDEIEIIIQRHGRGTDILADAKVGDVIDVLGPLGSPWQFDSQDYETALLLIGGVGVASMPLLTKHLQASGTAFLSYYGARTANMFADEYLTNVVYATDDGSKGYKGTIIDKLRNDLKDGALKAPKLFVCGPTPMMKAAIAVSEEFGIPCEVSLETEMACGIGICQGCPVPTTEAEAAISGKKFYLVCTQGPSFTKESIVL
ncbi:MAG TPA: dihydroorotate dehydrogenase electron transfer subunit, partial [Candidatus Kapabacteria bacterium]